MTKIFAEHAPAHLSWYRNEKLHVKIFNGGHKSNVYIDSIAHLYTDRCNRFELGFWPVLHILRITYTLTLWKNVHLCVLWMISIPIQFYLCILDVDLDCFVQNVKWIVNFELWSGVGLNWPPSIEKIHNIFCWQSKVLISDHFGFHHCSLLRTCNSTRSYASYESNLFDEKWSTLITQTHP